MNQITIRIYVVTLLLWCSALQADQLTPERFVRIDIEIHEITQASMLKQLETTDLTQREQLSLQAQKKIQAVFQKYGTTVSGHSVYGTHQQKKIKRWLRKNPEWQQRYDTLKKQFETINAKI